MRCLCGRQNGKAPQAFCCAFNLSLLLNPQPGAVAPSSTDSRETDTLQFYAPSFLLHHVSRTLVQLKLSPSSSQHGSAACPSFVCISATANSNIDEPHLTPYRCVSSFFNVPSERHRETLVLDRLHMMQTCAVCGASCFPPSCGLGTRDKTVMLTLLPAETNPLIPLHGQAEIIHQLELVTADSKQSYPPQPC